MMIGTHGTQSRLAKALAEIVFWETNSPCCLPLLSVGEGWYGSHPAEKILDFIGERWGRLGYVAGFDLYSID